MTVPYTAKIQIRMCICVICSENILWHNCNTIETSFISVRYKDLFLDITSYFDKSNQAYFHWFHWQICFSKAKHTWSGSLALSMLLTVYRFWCHCWCAVIWVWNSQCFCWPLSNVHTQKHTQTHRLLPLWQIDQPQDGPSSNTSSLR